MYFEPIQKNKDGEILNYTISNLEAMLQSEDSEERAAVANLGYALDRLVYDENPYVRAAVAEAAGKLGRDDLLEKLLDDESYLVRTAVAEQGYGLDKLVNDRDEGVRCTAREALEELQVKQ